MTNFAIDDADYQRWLNFKSLCMQAQYADGGAIGGRFSITFCETSIGYVVTGRDAVTGEHIDLSGDL